ncbi:fatty acyl-AMP ligase [Streptomyces sp. NPDC056921]|uniref:fatty acyl-AMP ligase n=1 Tax=Streptomyces sp. NPDC056921 TaxID=3345966 RepID=UPI0036407CC8
MSGGPASGADLVSVLRERVEITPDTGAVTLVRDPLQARDNVSLSYADLDGQARSVAVWLAERTEPGDRVLLLYPPGVEFTAAFFGCLYAGLIAVPAPLPGRHRHKRRRLARIVRDAQASVLLSDHSGLPEVEKWAVDEGLTDVVCHATDGADTDPEAWRPRVPTRPDSIALLQYTSGSTGSPKGVMVRHRNLLTNVDSVVRSLRLRPAHRLGGWIPLYHDMGLIGLMLPGVLRCGGYAQMDPMTFLRRPHQWLQMLDVFDVNATASPDFGYELCLRRVTDEQVADLDLSRVRAAVDGSEPIRAHTVTGFLRRFAAAGFPSDALVPMYGLAESTLLVTGSSGRLPHVVGLDVPALEENTLRRAAPGVPSRDLVGCGAGVDEQVRIVAPDSGEVLPEGRVGEIWLSGPSVTAGYWGNDEVTKATFSASTSDGQGPYLRTGDLGGLLDGDLFVTGRCKDVLVLHGRNIHPQDIEGELRAQHEELHDLHGAAFTVGGDDGTAAPESVVVLHEIRGHWGAERMAAVASAMKLTVAREFGVPVGAVLLLRPGGIRRTTSGKVERSAMRSLYLTRALEPLLTSEDPHLTAALDGRRPQEAV